MQRTYYTTKEVLLASVTGGLRTWRRISTDPAACEQHVLRPLGCLHRYLSRKDCGVWYSPRVDLLDFSTSRILTADYIGEKSHYAICSKCKSTFYYNVIKQTSRILIAILGKEECIWEHKLASRWARLYTSFLSRSPFHVAEQFLHESIIQEFW